MYRRRARTCYRDLRAVLHRELLIRIHTPRVVRRAPPSRDPARVVVTRHRPLARRRGGGFFFYQTVYAVCRWFHRCCGSCRHGRSRTARKTPSGPVVGQNTFGGNNGFPNCLGSGTAVFSPGPVSWEKCVFLHAGVLQLHYKRGRCVCSRQQPIAFRTLSSSRGGVLREARGTNAT